jgi:hypothetical protein
MKYLIGYRDALESLYQDVKQGHASYWTEEQYDANKWLLDKMRFRSEAVAQMVRDADRTQDLLDRRRKW